MRRSQGLTLVSRDPTNEELGIKPMTLWERRVFALLIAAYVIVVGWGAVYVFGTVLPRLFR